MKPYQPGIMQAVPVAGRYVFFSLAAPVDDQAAGIRQALRRLAALADGDSMVAALGLRPVAALSVSVPGLREFPVFAGATVEVPATPVALCVWLRGSDPGDLVLLTRQLEKALVPAFHLDRVVEAFRHGKGSNGHGRDLTGYEDGTENPQGEAAEAAAFVQGQEAGLEGSSFMAIQQWLHDFDAFEAMGTDEQDNAVGRRRSDNEELEDAPAAAHVKRTAQESFDPQAFVLRRSMPWAVHAPSGGRAGLMFVAFGRSFDAFEAQMRRMAGLEDGIVDAIFRISRPVTGSYLWCPPLRDGRLDLRLLGL